MRRQNLRKAANVCRFPKGSYIDLYDHPIFTYFDEIGCFGPKHEIDKGASVFKSLGSIKH